MFNFRAREISHMAKLKIETRREEELLRSLLLPPPFALLFPWLGNLRKCSWDDTECPEEEATLGQRPFCFTLLTDFILKNI